MQNSLIAQIRTKMTSRENRRVEMRRFGKFALVGALGSVTHFTLLNLLVQAGGVDEMIANLVGFITAVVQNFFLNRNWTYPESQSRHAGRQLVQFFIVSIVGLVLNSIVFNAVHWLLEPFWINLVNDPWLGHAISYNFAFMVAVGVVLFWNFAANRLWTYRGLAGDGEKA